MICKNQVVGRTAEGMLYIHPCGQCLNCRINDTRAWYVRSHFELKKLERPFHYFLTLTYAPEFYPDDGVCRKDHLKKFLNNLNTSFGLEMRYFATSDYGNETKRAHYHAIILSKKKITSRMVERIWKKGFITLRPCNSERIKYTLRYTLKKMPFDKTDKTMFRLISKGWGNNVADYYSPGQEYFIIDGKKYGITPYLAKKLGIVKEQVFMTKYFDSLYFSGNYKNVGNFDTYIADLTEFKQYLNRMSLSEKI